MNLKLQQLIRLLETYTQESVCLAFSGGVDSSLLLKLLTDQADENGTKVYAVTFDTRLHPACDLEIARRVAAELHSIHMILTVDELELEEIQNNPVNRCYLCKHHLFQTLKEFAAEKGISRIIDGTNEDDLHVYRPGIAALSELGISSPLAQLKISKAEVKEFAKYYGISVASRPSTPCMATRLPYGEQLDYEVLSRIEKGEQYLKSLIDGNIRIRLHHDIARIELDQASFSTAVERSREISTYLKGLGFIYITLDMEGFRSGSMDIFVKNNKG